MKILGFQSGHDVSYCVLDNGVPVIHAEYERYIRENDRLNIPVNSLWIGI